MKPLFIKKNGTVSKVSGIIMNLIPSYTLAEYNALTHKPLLWVRTDEEYAQIPASDVSYGSATVEDALDGLVNLSVLNGCGFSVVNDTPLSNGFLGLGLNYTKVPIAASVRNPYNTKIFISISRFVYDGGWYGFVEKYNSTSNVWETYTSQTAMSVLVFYKDLN